MYILENYVESCLVGAQKNEKNKFEHEFKFGTTITKQLSMLRVT
jgi:hypothetical protein